MSGKKVQMKKVIAVTVLLFLLLGIVPGFHPPILQAAAANYYVRAGATGSNNGTDWTNAWTGFGQINWSQIDAGSTIWVAGGTYGPFVIGANGTAGNPITIQRATTEQHGTGTGWNGNYDSQVIVDGNDGAYAIRIGNERRSYITIDGATKYGIWIRNGMYGISAIYGADYLTLRYLEIGDAGTYKNGEDGLQGKGDSLLLEYCYLHDNDIALTHGDNMQWFDGENIVIRYNIFKNGGQMGMLGEPTWDGWINNMSVYYNVFYNRGGGHYNGLNLFGPTQGNYINIFNNTFDLEAIDNNDFNCVIRITSDSRQYLAGINIKNNAITYSCGNYMSNTTHAYNAYDNSGDYIVWTIPSEPTRVTAADLGFVNIGGADYHLTSSSPLRAAGVNVGLTRDFDGNPVSTSNPCIGAFEYTGGATPPPTSTATVTPTPTSTPTPTPTPTSTPIPGEWYSKANYSQVQGLGSQNTGNVTMEYDVMPLQSMSTWGGVTGYADTSTTVDAYSKMAIIVRLNESGNFDARNGSGYSSLTTVPYSLNTAYHVKITADMAAKTYDVWVTSGGTVYKIADDYSFRTDAPATDDVGKVCLISEEGDNRFKVYNHTVSSASAEAYVGNKNAGGSNDFSSANDMNVFRFQASSSFTANTMKLYLNSAVSGNMKLAVYSDNNGMPGSFLKGTNQVSNPQAGWNTFTLTSGQTITSGAWYWLAVWSNAAYTPKCETSGGTLYYKNVTYGSWPATLTGMNGPYSNKDSIYASSLSN